MAVRRKKPTFDAISVGKMKLRTIFGCVLAGVLWVLLAADARCVASDGETLLPAPSELTRQVPVRVADAYGLRALLVRLSLEAGDTSAFDPDAGYRPGLSVPRRSVRRVGTGCLICPGRRSNGVCPATRI